LNQDVCSHETSKVFRTSLVHAYSNLTTIKSYLIKCLFGNAFGSWKPRLNALFTPPNT